MADEPHVAPDPQAPAALEAQLDEALRRAKTQLSHIRGNLALVATFLAADS